jgi:hypothetical protein
MPSRLVDGDYVKSFSVTFPESEVDDLQGVANDRFNGNRSLALRWACRRAFGFGHTDLRKLKTGDKDEDGSG